MQGQVFKIHSDFYYVCADGANVIECKLREVLKKQKQSVLVGDFVEVDEAGAIFRVLPRKNELSRPSVSNIDLAVIVSALMEPKLDFVQLNRYLTYLKYHKIETILCFNKEDLVEGENLSPLAKKITDIYYPLGYKILFTSAKEKEGLEEFKKEILGKTIVLTGLSGVGKSSLINAINPSFELKTKKVSKITKRGVHTTRHCSILDFGDFRIIDTPGFSNLQFDFLLPKDLTNLFDDIKKYAKNCKYSDCLHKIEETNESDCAVIKNINKIDKDRYKSYIEFIKEAAFYKQKVTYEGTKEENFKKSGQKKELAKISIRKRESARNTKNQKIKNFHIELEEKDEY